MEQSNLTFEEFKVQVKDEILRYLPETYGGADVTINEVLKNNDTKLSGLLIKADDKNIAPNIYLEGYFKMYQNGDSLDVVMRKIADTYLEHSNVENFDVSKITDWENVKDRIICRLINAEYNKEYLENKPHTYFEDLAVVYTVNLGENEEGRATVAITNDLMASYGVTVDELHQIALDNLSRSEMSFKSMRDVMIEMMGGDAAMIIPEEETPSMYVLTNESKIHGASAILDKGMLEHISDTVGGDFIVLPSSVHEVIVVPVMDRFNTRELQGMVHEVNATQVTAEEQLSENVYVYDSAEKELILADRMAERLKEREAQEQAQSQDDVVRRHRGR